MMMVSFTCDLNKNHVNFALIHIDFVTENYSCDKLLKES